MGEMIVCPECGRTFHHLHHAAGNTAYCSDGCYRKAKAANKAKEAETAEAASRSIANIGYLLKLIGIVFVALVVAITFLFYKFPKFLYGKNKKFLYAYIITWAVLIAGTVIYFSFFSPEAVSGIKTKIVSATCETDEKFVSIAKEAVSGLSITVLEGEEFTTYSQLALNTVKERNKTYSFNNSVFFVRLPDSVNVYLWFKTKDDIRAFVYKTNEVGKEKSK
ncbi:hypothetical protein [Treponema sp. R80B11-R83G3]